MADVVSHMYQAILWDTPLQSVGCTSQMHSLHRNMVTYLRLLGDTFARFFLGSTPLSLDLTASSHYRQTHFKFIQVRKRGFRNVHHDERHGLHGIPLGRRHGSLLRRFLQALECEFDRLELLLLCEKAKYC